MSHKVQRRSWDKLPDESDKDFRLFNLYKAIPPETRSLEKLAALTGRSKSGLARPSTRYKWVIRAGAWDEEQARSQDKGALAEAERIGREHAQAALMIRNLGLAELQRRALKVEKARKAVDAAGVPCDTGDAIISDRDALSMFKEGALLERLSLGQATERTEQAESAWDLSKLTAEELATLRALRLKATA